MQNLEGIGKAVHGLTAKRFDGILEVAFSASGERTTTVRPHSAVLGPWQKRTWVEDADVPPPEGTEVSFDLSDYLRVFEGFLRRGPSTLRVYFDRGRVTGVVILGVEHCMGRAC